MLVKCSCSVKEFEQESEGEAKCSLLISAADLFFAVEQHSLLCYRFCGGRFIIIRALMLLRFSSIPVCCPSSSGKILRTHEYSHNVFQKDMTKLLASKAP